MNGRGNMKYTNNGRANIIFVEFNWNATCQKVVSVIISPIISHIIVENCINCLCAIARVSVEAFNLLKLQNSHTVAPSAR